MNNQRKLSIHVYSRDGVGAAWTVRKYPRLNLQYLLRFSVRRAIVQRQETERSKHYLCGAKYAQTGANEPEALMTA